MGVGCASAHFSLFNNPVQLSVGIMENRKIAVVGYPEYRLVHGERRQLPAGVRKGI